VVVPYTPGDGSAQATLDQLRQVAPQLGLELLELPVQGAGQIDRLLANFPAGADAIFLPRDSTIEAQVRSFAAFARSRRLPLSAPGVAQVEAGALFAYGFLHKEIGRQAAGLADQILRGTRPADLPVETAENYLALNLRTAAAIGVAIPDYAVRQASVVVRP
jgi:putative ABC transport system substrate-binding protein